MTSQAVKGINLCDGTMATWFLRRLEACEYAMASRGGMFSEYETDFLKDMRYRFDTRDQDTDFGLTPWNPTRKQWNMLDGLYERIRV